jgi:membrane-bound serine protease (ClpP class)
MGKANKAVVAGWRGYLIWSVLVWVGLGLSGRGGEVLLARVSETIGPISARYLVQCVNRAERDDATCLIVELDTPGGLDDSMRQVIKRFLAAQVPIVVYVAPAGARAASAGAFITLSAHVAAMAPGTTIGAAHPVSLLGEGGQADATMEKKVTNDAAAYIRSIAEKRGRNATWAEAAVRESVAISETEALDQKVIDLVAPSRAALLTELDGRSVQIGDKAVVLKTAGVPLVEVPMNWRDRLLASVAHPNVAYVLFMLGLLGLYFEFSSPGAILPGVTGVICLILAFFAFQTLSVSYAGMLLIVLSMVLFVVDVKAATHGVLTIGGLVSLFMGSVMLLNAPDPARRVSLSVIIPVVLAVGGSCAVAVWLSLRSQFRTPVSGAAALIGQEGDARTAIRAKGGTVFVAGAHWNAVAVEEIPMGKRVRVTGVNRMTLAVEEVK